MFWIVCHVIVWPSSMTSYSGREAIWPNDGYRRAKEGFELPSHPFSLEVKIPRRMSNSVREFVVENVFSIH